MYIELDHGLVAGKVKDINEKTVLEGRKEERVDGPFGSAKYLLNKYNISKQPVKDVLLKKGYPTEKTLSPAAPVDLSLKPASKGGSSIFESLRKLRRNLKTDSEALETSKHDQEKPVKKEEEFVLGSDGEVFFDHDFGFFGAILACYNNHWVLKTSPDDWWNVIVR